ncbi:MAG TPA: hypothetical protein VK914_04870 [bacterium]|nr:hypothetical protein [bacterium]
MKAPLRFSWMALGLCLGLAAGSLPADQAQRPDEDSLFGGAPQASAPGDSSAAAQSAAPEAVSPGPSAPAPSADQSRGSDTDSGGLSQSTLGHDDFANGSVKDDALQVGGIVYQQLYMDESLYQAPGNSALSMPLQVDTYLDARPNDRLRAYVDGRLIYDPTKNAEGEATSGSNYGALSAGSTSVSQTANPTVVLDQAWVNFDVNRTVFLTVGKQHVKWGTGHIWNPTDFLTVQKLNPLQPYDLRLGDTMVKAQMPVQGMTGTNLYAVALLDNPVPASTLGQTGGGFRVETLLWGAEVGLDAVTRAGQYPAYGADLSTPLGPFDVYVENALLSGADYPDYVSKSPSGADPTLSSFYGVNLMPGPMDQTVAGISYDFPWREDRQATVGAEYFYNELGLGSAKLLPILIYEGNYTPFYMGKNYAAIYLSAEGPDEGKKTSYNLSNIANLSDGSAVSRLDFSWILLDYLTFGAWASAHYGTAGGELNFAVNTPAIGPLIAGNPTIPAVHVPPVPVELGMSLRMSY